MADAGLEGMWDLNLEWALVMVVWIGDRIPGFKTQLSVYKMRITMVSTQWLF